MRVLVTAGPTREAIDPVRFLSNRSSGRMGYAIAQALLAAGHEVVLVSGPVQITPPAGALSVQVESALQMLDASLAAWPDCDAMFAVAAVADYRPKQVSEQKLKRQEGEGQFLELIPNPDIVATLAAIKQQRLVIGFALESHHGLQHARAKMQRKCLDVVVLNGPEAQGAASSRMTILKSDGSQHDVGPLPKAELAVELVRYTLANGAD
ncbi:MAG: phosphopantothenoylcysteine decarboxylase [Planctomycetes bacterium]|nr:phosphopantothenoylcysteine decarboxylase [Planctomycetota bacterium]